MASLLSFPNEVLIQVLIASPTTRTLLRLSSVNRRMRAIWVTHSRRIIVANYKPKIQHVEQAITLTLTEVGTPWRYPDFSKRPWSYHHRTRIDLRPSADSSLPTPNATKCWPRPSAKVVAKINASRRYPGRRRTGGARYFGRTYLIRHMTLAYDYPQLRPAVLSTIAESSMAMLVVNTHVFYYLMRVASYKIRGAHAMVERNCAAWSGTQRDPDEDRYRFPDKWRAVSQVLTMAEYYHEIGIEERPSFDTSRTMMTKTSSVTIIRVLSGDLATRLVCLPFVLRG
jgi:hypothetical protein